MKLKRLTNTYGINKHKHYEVELGEGKRIKVNSNEDVLGDKWYLTNGEGSDTKWYATPQEAAKAYLNLGCGAFHK